MYKLTYVILVVLMYGCVSVPITHRKQMSLVPEMELINSSKLAYAEFLEQNDVIHPYNPASRKVKEIGEAIVSASQSFLLAHGGAERVAGFEWEFNVVKNPEVNAWCMPGGKIIVYTGLMDVVENDFDLAVILSHEIAHSIARHSNERVSRKILADIGSGLIETFLMSTNYSSGALDDLILQTYSYGMSLGGMKFSKNQEMEADKMGMVFMEYAGYDADYAIDFWTRFAENENGRYGSLYTTHPSHETRVLELQTFLPVAKSYVK